MSVERAHACSLARRRRHQWQRRHFRRRCAVDNSGFHQGRNDVNRRSSRAHAPFSFLFSTRSTTRRLVALAVAFASVVSVVAVAIAAVAAVAVDCPLVALTRARARTSASSQHNRANESKRAATAAATTAAATADALKRQKSLAQKSSKRAARAKR